MVQPNDLNGDIYETRAQRATFSDAPFFVIHYNFFVIHYNFFVIHYNEIYINNWITYKSKK